MNKLICFIFVSPCVLQEADTDDNQGSLGFDEFCSFYKMMSTRRDLYLLMLTYSNHKDHLDTDDLARFLEIEQKVTNYGVLQIWDMFIVKHLFSGELKSWQTCG